MDVIIEKIIQYFAGNNQISAVYLFGSAAKNLMGPKSDIDIAVLFETKVKSKMKRFDFILSAGIDLENIVGRPFDVVDILEAPLVLQHQILKTGKLLVENNRLARINFEVSSRRQYFDMLPLYTARNKNILQKFRG
ncbi:type VII toxin-antitoxin system MntA family adenylyltransferase antitoxin [Desulfoscipio geothermicus]|uniref:Predicted nucleotidyltransferase n=1 Tax=Desulfoscipio geothermicus DSM 3669 TaxID=1121426 RepID=A0A1I6DE09_9FIRM|nr:nucleotidyltransferase domain-containing protein [Desulfoscipio geothermicus]SFR03689.1 Predicted nucleotidyltransferase [Desulfoscipio geothermicus DSM 3669]